MVLAPDPRSRSVAPPREVADVLPRRRDQRERYLAVLRRLEEDERRQLARLEAS